MKVQLHLKGLLPGEDIYEDAFITITATDQQNLNSKIDAAIYEYRITHGYYKIKYQEIKVIDLSNDSE